MKKTKEISVFDLLQLDKDEFVDAFNRGNGSIIAVPPEGYVLNWDKIRTTEDLKAVLMVLSKALLPSIFYMSEKEYEDSPLKNYLELITTSSKRPGLS